MMEDEFYKEMNLFNFEKEEFKFSKKLRIIEMFSGIGAQAKALEILGIPFEHHKTVEWAANSIIGYNAIHNGQTKNENNLDSDFLAQKLYELGVSLDYNCPASLKQLKRIKNDKLNLIYESIQKTNNLVNIMNVHGEDLDINETDKYEYLLTYSFPCQDISNAGKKQGLAISQKEGGTRSGLLWEVERILNELKSLSLSRKENKMPSVLLMENVPDLVGVNFVDQFNRWREKLEKLGYTNYVEILNAKDYGIPQNRRRCFMVSVYGDYAYEFPIPFKRKHDLKDLLDIEFDEKYILSEKRIKTFLAENTGKYKRKEAFLHCLDMARGGVISNSNNTKWNETNRELCRSGCP